MFLQILSSIAGACNQVYDWFCSIIIDGFGDVAITFVLGMVFLGVVFRFLLAPAMSHAGNLTRSLSRLTSVSSDSVSSKEKPHPDFSEKG